MRSRKATTLNRKSGGTKPSSLDGCPLFAPMFAPAYMGRKRIFQMLSLHCTRILLAFETWDPRNRSRRAVDRSPAETHSPLCHPRAGESLKRVGREMNEARGSYAGEDCGLGSRPSPHRSEADGSAVSFLASPISGSKQSVPNETQHGLFDSAKPQSDCVTGPWQSPPQKQRYAFAATPLVKGFQIPRAICR
jgi:hypothetical protein